ncbi:50S ribosomal protein L5 [Candidatus Woesearchaeota archaeon]|nr:50S ribosomal protein L5 [Candidatus Woesearchaeota archaeon]MBW3021517.1 50S ribosomal protein L5 [Candidatus Woesearchaeota archaeon]
MNVMKSIRIEKITLNIGAGKDVKKLEKGMKLLKNITGIEPIKTYTSKRIPGWGLRPGLPIGCKLTLRGTDAEEVLKRLLEAKTFLLNESQFDDSGNIAFGVPEYIDIKDAKYDPEIGIMGLEVCVTLERPGFRVKRRKNLKSRVGKNHCIAKEEAIKFMKDKFGIRTEEEDDLQ